VTRIPDAHKSPTVVAIRLARVWTYDADRRIGLPGGFGEVFEGRGDDGAAVAVKKIRPVSPGLATGEIKVARRLMQVHPDHVIPILDAGHDVHSGERYLVMPLAEESLQDRLMREGPLADDEAMAVLQDVLLGLHEMSGIVHGDLKPANVLFHEERWKLADMGIARIIGEEPTQPAERMFVTEPYAAPEQWRFETATRATDVYAFGCLAYAVLTGAPPFPGPRQEDFCRQHLDGTPRALPASPPVRALVQMCLAKEAGSRPSVETALILLERAWAKS
jgi:serine/threonine protein kinase